MSLTIRENRYIKLLNVLLVVAIITIVVVAAAYYAVIYLHLKDLESILNNDFLNESVSAKVALKEINLDLKERKQWLFVITLLVVIAEFFFVFSPILKSIKNDVSVFVNEKNDSVRVANNALRSYEKLSLSHSKLSSINLALNKLTIYASANGEGRLEAISENYCAYLELNADELIHQSLHKLFYSSIYGVEFEKALLENLSNGETWEQEVMSNVKGVLKWSSVVIVPVLDAENTLVQILIFAQDITDKKKSEEALRDIKEIQRQNKYNVASISGMKMDEEKLENRMLDIKAILANTIREVRRVSFNLTPNELTDYGFASACKNFVSEINKVTNLEVFFENTTDFQERLDGSTEQNLYRILQEAVNNSIKYSDATNIYVILKHSNNFLTLSIQDDGVGFDANKVFTKDIFKISGHGLFNMKERANLIGAKFNVKTALGRGTHIIIDVPLSV